MIIPQVATPISMGRIRHLKCFFATEAIGSRSASRRIATICSSVNLDLRICPSVPAGSLSSYPWFEKPGAGHDIYELYCKPVQSRPTSRRTLVMIEYRSGAGSGRQCTFVYRRKRAKQLIIFLSKPSEVIEMKPNRDRTYCMIRIRPQ